MSFEDANWKTIDEGKTSFQIVEDADRIYDASVFYNPNMVINRDLTILSISIIYKIHKEGLIFLDAFAGTGIRSFRILNELPAQAIKLVIINDINPKAIEIIEKNISDRGTKSRLQATKSDAFNLIASYVQEKKPVDIIDIDPFGSPISQLEISLKALRKNEGFLFATATDLQVLCGKFPDACQRLYNSIPTRHFLCHEVALRILLYNVLTSAGRLGLAIEPLVSYHHEHFLRIKVKVENNKEKANKQHKMIGFVIFCTKCSYYQTVFFSSETKLEKCPICSDNLEKAGPVWLGNLYDKEFVKEMIQHIDKFDFPSEKRVFKLLNIMNEELEEPLFYYLPFIMRICKKKGVTREQIIDKLHENGFTASRTVFDPQSIKTNAEYSEIVHIIEQF